MNRRRFLTISASGLGVAVLPWRIGHAHGGIPSRVVIAGGALTEIAVALGIGEHLVGVDTTSLYPWNVVEPLPKIGYLRTLGAEGVLSLNPTLLLVSDQAGPPGILDQLRGTKLPVVVVPENFSSENVVDKIKAVAAALTVNGTDLADGVAADFATVKSALAKVVDCPKVLFILSAAGGRLMAAGSHTAAASMIELAGGRNAIDGYEGYKPLSGESAIAANPDFILVSTQTLESAGGKETLKALPMLAVLDAVKTDRLFVMEALYLLGFGPRTPYAVLDLARFIHPRQTLPTLPSRAWMKV